MNKAFAITRHWASRHHPRPSSPYFLAMMQINVLRELRQPIGTVTVVDFEEPSARVDGTHLLDLCGSVSMLRTNAGLLVTLTAEAHERSCCSRCLKDIDVPIEIAFEEEYVPVIDATTGHQSAW